MRCAHFVLVLLCAATGRARGATARDGGDLAVHGNVRGSRPQHVDAHHRFSWAFAAPHLAQPAAGHRRAGVAATRREGPVARRLRTLRRASEPGPAAGPDERVSCLIADNLADLHARLMQAPWGLGARAPAEATAVSVGELQAEPGNPASARTAARAALLLCEQLRTHHFAIVRLDPASGPTMDRMWLAARRFFGLPWQERLAAAGAHRRASGNVGVVGWDIMPDGNEILEMRVAA